MSLPRALSSKALSLSLIASLFLVASTAAQDDHSTHNHPAGQHPTAKHTAASHGKPAWDRELVESFARLNVLERGRVKPLYTQAIWLLRRLNGKASVTTPPTEDFPDGQRLGPVEWYLDALFFPEHANDYEVFRIENDNVLDALNLKFRDAEGFKTNKRFDRYSFNELSDGFDELQELGTAARKKDTEDQTALEANLAALYSNVLEYANLINHLNFARSSIPVEPALQALFDGRQTIQVSDALLKVKELHAFALKLQDPEALSAEDQAAGRKAYDALTKALRSAVSRSDHDPVIFPPSLDREQAPAWMTPQDLVMTLIFKQGKQPQQDLDSQVRLLATLEAMTREAHDAVAFRKDAEVFIAGLTHLAHSRGEGSKTNAEVWLYERDFFWTAIYAFLAGFILLAISWLFRLGSNIRTGFGLSTHIILAVGLGGILIGIQAHSLLGLLWFVPVAAWLLKRDVPVKVHLVRGALGFALLGAALAVVGMSVRCYVRGRPPVTTLFETFIFITTTCVLVALVIEWVRRQGLGLAVALVLGFVGLMLGNSYAGLKAEDTMPQLVAVLDTNFWLSTHVVTISIGYGAGMIAGFIAHIFLIGKLFGFKKDDRAFYKDIVRMVYGVLCFGLIFSVVGTILGGIWANDSWGRFWGWDPKENGALLICLAQAAILHGRMGGFLRDYGICIWAVIGNMVVAWSWFHVNLLGIGLHNYGFDGALYRNLVIFYSFQGLVILCGIVAWLMDRARQSAIEDARYRRQASEADLT